MATEAIPDKIVFGLDIGTRSVVGTVGHRKPGGQFVILAQKSICHETRAMLDGQIHDIGKVADTVCAVRDELERELNIKLDEVCIAAAGRVLKTITVRMNYDLGDDMTISEDMVFAMELMGMEQASSRLREQEKDGTPYYCVGYTVVKYYLGNTPMLNLEGHRGKSIGADVLATFLPRDVIDGLNAVCDRAGLKVANLTLEPIAAINIAIPEKFRLLNLALVDIGAGTSDVCITKEGSIIGYGMLPCAGDFLTESIMYACLTDFSTAENIKLDFAAKKKKITYKDVMGLKQTITYEEVENILREPNQKLATMIAEKIIELNGGEKTSAIFIVGGGGKGVDFASILAEKSGLPSQRVALRGEEVFSNILTADGKTVSDPMLVTPLGICMNYYEQNNNFIVVRLNGYDVKLYDNGHLNVMDATVGVGIPNERIFPRRGDNLEYVINGNHYSVKGKAGDSSVITVNGETASVSTPIKANDIIELTESTIGESGIMILSETDQYRAGVRFVVNGKQIVCKPMCLMNGTRLDPSYSIQNGDEIEVCDYYYLEDILNYLDVGDHLRVVINNSEIDLDNYNKQEKIYENYIIDLPMKESGSMLKMIKEVHFEEDTSDGETIIDDRILDREETYEEYLDRRYGRNQYKSFRPEEVADEEDNQATEPTTGGFGAFGRMSAAEMTAIIAGSRASSFNAGTYDFGSYTSDLSAKRSMPVNTDIAPTLNSSGIVDKDIADGKRRIEDRLKNLNAITQKIASKKTNKAKDNDLNLSSIIENSNARKSDYSSFKNPNMLYEAPFGTEKSEFKKPERNSNNLTNKFDISRLNSLNGNFADNLNGNLTGSLTGFNNHNGSLTGFGNHNGSLSSLENHNKNLTSLDNHNENVTGSGNYTGRLGNYGNYTSISSGSGDFGQAYENMLENLRNSNYPPEELAALAAKLELSGMNFTSSTEPAIEKPNKTITVTVNGTEVVLDGKPDYLFVDILDKYDFDTKVAHGTNVVMKRNGVNTEFIKPISDGDIIDLYWE